MQHEECITINDTKLLALALEENIVDEAFFPPQL